MAQVNGNEQLGVAPEDAEKRAVKSNNGVFADFGCRHGRLGDGRVDEIRCYRGLVECSPPQIPFQ
jgi:hypothetical protein